MNHTVPKPKRCPHPAEILARWMLKALLLVGAVVALFTLVGCAGGKAESRKQKTESRAVTPPQWRGLRAEWDASAGAEGYFVYHAPVPSYNAMLFLGATTNTWFDFQSQKFGFVGVKATNHVGLSNWGIPKQ